MDTNNVKKLDDYLKGQGLPSYKMVTSPDDNDGFGYMTTITFDDNNIRVSVFGQTPAESVAKAAKDALDKCLARDLLEEMDQLNVKFAGGVGVGGGGDGNQVVVDKGSVIDNTVGSLQELSVKHSYSQPVYEEIERSGSDHEPMFTIQCRMTINGQPMFADGRAATKKLAKSMAAQEMIKLLPKQTDISKTKLMSNSSVTHINLLDGQDLDDFDDNYNYIGCLQEFCIKKLYSQPVYEFSDRTGTDHQPMFTFECRVTVTGGRQLVAKGQGLTKKDAKSRSAHAMTKLVDQSHGNTGNNETNRSSISTTLPSMTTDQLVNYFLSIDSERQSELNRCLLNSLTQDYCQKLDKMATLLDCRVSYAVHAIGVTNHVICKLMILSTDYCLITTDGTSREGYVESKRLAAKKALLMAKILFQN